MQVNQSLLTLVPLSLGMQPLDKPSVSPSFHPARGHSHNTPNPQAAIHPTLAGRRGGGKKPKQKKTSWVSPSSQRPKMQGQITSRDLLSAAGPSLHRPQSFPAPPAAHKHANRQIHYAVFVCVRVGSRLQIHRRPASHVPLPSSLPKSLSPLSLLLPPSVEAANL